MRKPKEGIVFISIHAAQEGCDMVFLLLMMTVLISIHAAQEGCDKTPQANLAAFGLFQSTQPKRAATDGGAACS